MLPPYSLYGEIIFEMEIICKVISPIQRVWWEQPNIYNVGCPLKGMSDQCRLPTEGYVGVGVGVGRWGLITEGDVRSM